MPNLKNGDTQLCAQQPYRGAAELLRSRNGPVLLSSLSVEPRLRLFRHTAVESPAQRRKMDLPQTCELVQKRVGPTDGKTLFPAPGDLGNTRSPDPFSCSKWLADPPHPHPELPLKETSSFFGSGEGKKKKKNLLWISADLFFGLDRFPSRLSSVEKRI